MVIQVQEQLQISKKNHRQTVKEISFFLEAEVSEAAVKIEFQFKLFLWQHNGKNVT
jgi:hypothetical protein